MPSTQDPQRMNAYHGLRLAIVRASGRGTATLQAKADGLAAAEVMVTGE